jgi:cobalt-zinc-cadmium resistance protein CzcA
MPKPEGKNKMLEKLIATMLKQRGLVIFLSLLIIGFGVFSYLKLPIDAFPDVTNIQVDVVSYADGLSAVEIERSVTHPIEMSMRGLPKVQQMRSVTKFGLSLVTIVFEDNVDIYFARQLVFERLAEARQNVPDGVAVSMGPIATVMGEIYQFTLQGAMPVDPAKKKEYLMDLRTLQEYVVNPLLKNVPGVNEVNSFGGYFKQYDVVVSPDMLLKYNLTIDDIFTAIEKNNRNAGGNIIEKYADQYIVRGVGLIKDTTDIGNVILKATDGTPTYLRDVSKIEVGVAVRQGAAMINGSEEAVGGIVMMLRGENSRDVVNRVKKKVQEINDNNILPSGIRIVPYYDRSDIVNASVGTVNKALLEGAILVLIILYVLLRSIRGSLVVLMGLPLSLLLTFIVMKLFGLSANLMSLGGLAISIGMIIDATIIQVENVQRYLSEGNTKQPKILTILKAVLEVRKPTIFGELIIAITIIPILSLEGIEGKMFAPLAQTVAIALLSSLVISIFITPGLCLMFLKSQPEKEGGITSLLKKWYMPLLHVCMKKKKLILVIASISLCVSLGLFTKIGTEFIPVMDESAFDLDVSLLPGVSLDKAMEINKLIATKMKKFPELETCVSRTGQTGVALDTRGVDKTGYVGVLHPKKEWKSKMTHEELTNAMRDSLASIPGITFSFSQPIQCRIDETVAGTKAQLIIKLFGDNLDILKTKADEIAKLLLSVRGCTDLVTEQISGQPYLTIEIDRKKIARYGLNISDVQNIIEIALAGKSASKLFEESKSFDITIRLPEEDRSSVEAIGNILVPLPNGSRIPLCQLSTIAVSEGPVQISREDGLRRIGIELNIQGRDIGGFVAAAQQTIKEKANLPPGYFVAWGGQFANQQRAMAKLLLIGPVAIGLILLLLFVVFRNIRLALLVLSNLPFALIGGIFALWISGQYVSVPAAVGFIVLFGVAVLNGVVLVSHITQLREEGLELTEAIEKGCTNRLRPVIMTASIAIFSLIPMLYSSGTGSEIQKPLATVVVGGLITSTFLTLFLIPSLYGWFENRKKELEM